MKSKISNQDFKPITLTIKMETQRELELIWAILNASFDDTCEMVNKSIGDFKSIQKFNNEEAELRLLGEISRLFTIHSLEEECKKRVEYYKQPITTHKQ